MSGFVSVGEGGETRGLIVSPLFGPIACMVTCTAIAVLLSCRSPNGVSAGNTDALAGVRRLAGIKLAFSLTSCNKWTGSKYNNTDDIEPHGANSV